MKDTCINCGAPSERLALYALVREGRIVEEVRFLCGPQCDQEWKAEHKAQKLTFAPFVQ
jgi:hypothetical protein